MLPPTEPDVLVVGGGPAGAVLAAQLAEWKRSVLLVDRGRRRGSLPEETLVPAAREALERHGLLTVIRAHDFHGTERHGVIWGDGKVTIRKNPPDARGYKVHRPTFDTDLRNIARSMGATILEDHEVLGPVAHGDENTVHIRSSEGDVLEIRPRLIVLATGKEVSPKLSQLGLVHQLPAMVALTTYLAPPVTDTDSTVVEAVPEGWLWWLPLHDGRISLTLFCDPEEMKSVGRNDLFESACRHAAGPASTVTASPRSGCRATPRFLRTRDPFLLVGDAASSIDPLSSQGVEKAIVSAEWGAVAANTILEHPELAQQVLDQHFLWEKRLYFAHAQKSLHFYLQEARFSDRPFWAKRHEAVQVEVERNREGLRGLPALIQVSEGLSLRPALRRKGRLYESVEGWGLPGSGEVFDAIGRVPLAPLVKFLRAPRSTDEVLTLASEHPDLYLLSPRIIQQALTEMARLGMIQAVD